MMDAGKALKAPVAGIAMGLAGEGDSFVVLSDIRRRDHLGDMDQGGRFVRGHQRPADGHQDRRHH